MEYKTRNSKKQIAKKNKIFKKIIKTQILVFVELQNKINEEKMKLIEYS